MVVGWWWGWRAESNGQRAKKSVIRSFVVSQSESELNSECCCDLYI
jgi:hypothetical protein